MGKARKIKEPTMIVTATRNFIFRSQSLTINVNDRQPGGDGLASKLTLYEPGGDGERYPGWRLSAPQRGQAAPQ